MTTNKNIKYYYTSPAANIHIAITIYEHPECFIWIHEQSAILPETDHAGYFKWAEMIRSLHGDYWDSSPKPLLSVFYIADLTPTWVMTFGGFKNSVSVSKKTKDPVAIKDIIAMVPECRTQAHIMAKNLGLLI